MEPFHFELEISFILALLFIVRRLFISATDLCQVTDL